MTTKKPKFKLPTAKQIQRTLPAVSAGLSFLSVLPFNRTIKQTLALTATATGALGTGHPTPSVKSQLRTALEKLSAATTPDEIHELTITVIALAKILVDEK